MKHDTKVTFKTSELYISYISRVLGLENKTDFQEVTMSIALWISSEIALGRKIFSSTVDLSDKFVLPMMDKDGMRELLIRRAENQKLYKNRINYKKSEDINWLIDNLGQIP